MADDHPIPAYPLMFSADQWSNKYSPFAGKPIPFPAQYRGAPTDALGRPIQSYQDAQAQHDAWAKANPAPAMAPAVTLNSPSSGARFPTGSPLDRMQQAGAPPAQMQAAFSQMSPTYPGGQTNPNYAPSLMAMMGGGSAAGGAQQGAGGAQATNPIDMNQAYLDALSNPGKVVTPGATVPQSPLPSNQSGVLQQFLQNWQNGGGQTKGAGNYDNSGFFKALQGGMPGDASAGGGGSMMPPPAQGVPGTAFSQPLQQGGSGLSFGAGLQNVGNGNTLLGLNNTPPGAAPGANFRGYSDAQRKLMGI